MPMLRAVLLSCVVLLISLPTLSAQTTLDWGTIATGDLFDFAFAAAERSDGTVVVAGATSSPFFPTTAHPAPTPQGNEDVVVLCFDPSLVGAAQLLWVSYLAGDDLDAAFELVIDDQDRAWVVGLSQSSNFPTTAGAFSSQPAGSSDGFVARFGVGGTLEWATRIGGSGREAATGLMVAGDRVWVAGTTDSADFPTTVGAPQEQAGGGLDQFVVELASDVSGAASLRFGSYLGGTGDEGLFPAPINGQTFEVDRVSLDRSPTGLIAVAGSTTSSDFPTTVGAVQTGLAGIRDGSVAILELDGSGGGVVSYGSYLGGTNDEQIFDVRWLDDDHLALGGTTVSNDFPVTTGAFQGTYGGGGFDGFVAKLDRLGSGLGAIETSTYFGGTSDDSIVSLSVIGGDVVAVVGNSLGNVPTTPDALVASYLPGFAFAGRAQIFDLAATGSAQLLYSTFLSGPTGSIIWGGSAREGRVTVAGWTNGDDLPVANPFASDVDFIGMAILRLDTPFFTPPGPIFRRGDVNDDGALNIADAVAGLSELFSSVMAVDCDEAKDVNDDGAVNIADPVFLLGVIFGGTQTLPEPVSCGIDPAPAGLDCAAYTSCP